MNLKGMERSLLRLVGMLLLVHPAHAVLNVPFTVKENQGVRVVDWPVQVIVPLPRGQTATVDQLGVQGKPSQVRVLEVWPQDKSLRHVAVRFLVTLEPYETAVEILQDQGMTSAPVAVSVRDDGDGAIVDTGKIKFSVKSTLVNFIDSLYVDWDEDGVYSDDELIIEPGNLMGGGHLVGRDGTIQYDTSRQDITFEVEEAGPLVTVLKWEAPTLYTSTTDHMHGFAVRLYAYAGQSYVKYDYQVQNSAKVIRAWPLYLDAFNIDFKVNMANPEVQFGFVDGTTHQGSTSGVSTFLQQDSHSSYRVVDGSNTQKSRTNMDYADFKAGTGFLSVKSSNAEVSVIGRNFWQQWPNGLGLLNDDTIRIEFYPEWSARWEGVNGKEGGLEQGRTSPSGLYWIEDMQHVVKENFVVFHTQSMTSAETPNMAKTFQFYPVASVDPSWIRQAHATLDLGGMIPPLVSVPTDTVTPDSYYSSSSSLDPDSYTYRVNVANWGDPEPGYRAFSATTGGWPYPSSTFYATGNSADYFQLELWGIGEMNCRGQWLAGFDFDADYASLQLTENPYGGGSWRVFDGHGISIYDAAPLDGTERVYPFYFARDDSHGWFYHAFDAYFATGNPWISDWYKFIYEFRFAKLTNSDPFPDSASRARGHSLHHFYQAGRITGRLEYLEAFIEHVRLYLRPDQDPTYGHQRSERNGAGFQTGYLMRTMIAFLDEVKGTDAQAWAEVFNCLSGMMAWNLNHGNFAYYNKPEEGTIGTSSGTGLSIVDPQAWYYWNTGKRAVLNHLEDYVDGGIGGGNPPFGSFYDNWAGSWEGRFYTYVRQTNRADATPPPVIEDARCSRSGEVVTLQWTTPVDAERFHIIWSDKPISEDHSLDPFTSNWWAANAVGVTLPPTPNQVQEATFDVPLTIAAVNCALFTFDSAENMSKMSNVASTLDPPSPPIAIPPTPTPPPATPPVSMPIPPAPTPPAPTPPAPTLPSPTPPAPTMQAPTEPPTAPPSRSCFPKVAKVWVEHRADPVPIHTLSVGDRILSSGVRTIDSSSTENDVVYETIYTFGHWHDTQRALFLQLTTTDLASRGGATPKTETSILEISGEHLVFVRDREGPIRADNVQVGDILFHVSLGASIGGGSNIVPVVVTDIQMVERDGVYAPLTPSGRLVVDGIQVSAYAGVFGGTSEYVQVDTQKGSSLVRGILQANLAHAALSPLRLVCTYISSKACAKKQCDENGVHLYVAHGMKLLLWSEGQSVLVQFGLLGVALCVTHFFLAIETLLSSVSAFIVLVIVSVVAAVYCKATATLTKRIQQQVPQQLKKDSATKQKENKLQHPKSL